MTTINFPNDPSIGDEYTFGNKTWVWNGTGWAVSSAATLFAEDSQVVHNSGDEVIAGSKTFSTPPCVPLPSQAIHAVPRQYVDEQKLITNQNVLVNPTSELNLNHWNIVSSGTAPAWNSVNSAPTRGGVFRVTPNIAQSDALYQDYPVSAGSTGVPFHLSSEMRNVGKTAGISSVIVQQLDSGGALISKHSAVSTKVDGTWEHVSASGTIASNAVTLRYLMSVAGCAATSIQFKNNKLEFGDQVTAFSPGRVVAPQIVYRSLVVNSGSFYYWYRIWSDGYWELNGYLYNTGTALNYNTFTLPFIATTYTCGGIADERSGNATALNDSTRIYSRDTTSIQFHNTTAISWMVTFSLSGWKTMP